MSVLDVDTVATDGDLADELGGTDALQNLVPKSWLGKAEKARQIALDDVLRTLATRTPPIAESDLADASELQRCVVLGACADLYMRAMTVGDAQDVNANKHRHYRAEYKSHRDSLRPTVSITARPGPRSIAFHRR